eukprot:2199467-Rhodomonas_salina.1
MRYPVLAQRTVLCDIPYWPSIPCYAMSGTGPAYRAMAPPVMTYCMPRALSGTDIAYAAAAQGGGGGGRRCSRSRAPIGLRAPYAMP